MVTGCGRKNPATAATPAGATETDTVPDLYDARWAQGAEVPIEIQNRHKLDLAIYVVSSGRRQRIALATAVSSTYVRIPARQLGPGNELQLMAYAIGAARRIDSGRMVVMPGQQVVWTIDNGFRSTSLAVWE
jgi:hypothetical protein